MKQEELEQIQQEALYLAKQVVDICEQHALTYYLVEGSLLGAVRHQGMIPWDDDIDIAMPRQDYDRVLEILDRELPDGCQAVDYRRRESHLRYFVQVESDRITVEEQGHHKPLKRHVWIDIFPLDGVPDGWLRQKKYLFKLLWLRMMIQFAQFEEIVDTQRVNRPYYEKLMMKLALWLKPWRYMNAKKRIEKLDAFLRTCPYGSTNYVINPVSAYKGKAIMPLNFYGEGMTMPFADYKWHVPGKPDEMLKQLYGNYAQPPRDKDMQNHHIRVVTIKSNKRHVNE